MPDTSVDIPGLSVERLELETERSLPSMTGAQRMGKIIAKERFCSLFVNGLTATFARDDWCKITGDLVGTGKYDKSVEEESITAADTLVIPILLLP